MIENSKDYQELQLQEKAQELSHLSESETAERMETLLGLFEEYSSVQDRPDPVSLRQIIHQGQKSPR